MDSLLLAGLNNAAWAAALALAAAVVGKVRHRRPALIHALWLLVLVKLLTPSLVHVQASGRRELASGGREPPVFDPIRKTGGSRPPLAEGTRQGADAPRSPELLVRRGSPDPAKVIWRWRAIIGVSWLTGSVLWCSAVVLGVCRFRRLLQSARPAPDELRDHVERIARKMNLRRVPLCFVVSARVPPMIWALIGPPKLILPADLWTNLSDPERDAILAHELSHLKRRDEWARRLEAVALGLYWWNPVAWWARREVERAEEQCCDAWVLWALPGAGSAYARALVMTADFLSQSKSRHSWPAGASGAGHFPPLKRRLTMILNHAAESSNPKPRSVSRIVVVPAVMSLLLLPAWALSEPPKAEALKTSPDVPKATAETKAAHEPAAKAPVLDAPPEIADKVKFAQVVTGEVYGVQYFMGNLVDVMPISVQAPLVGAVRALHPSGTIVEQGTPLFEYVVSDQAELDHSEVEVDRLEKLLASVGSKPQLPQKAELDLRYELTAGLRRARAQRDRAKIHQSAHQIKSPNRGKITLYNQTSMQKAREVTDQHVVATITPTDSILVDYRIDQTTFLKLRRQKIATGKKSALDVGSPVEVMVAGDSGRYSGQIVAIDPTFDSKSHTLHCRASMPNPDGLFIPGMSATVTFPTGEPREALWFPSEAVSPIESGSMVGAPRVWVVNDQNVIERRFVNSIPQYAGKYEVKDGLMEGDWVVVSGQNLVKPGMKVKQ